MLFLLSFSRNLSASLSSIDSSARSTLAVSRMEEADRNLGYGAKERSKRAADQLAEDEKVDKFYDLIRNYKEARDRQRIRLQSLAAGEESGDEDRKKKKLKLGDRDQPSWIPAFKWEDFTEKAPAECRRSPVILPASNLGEINKISDMQEDMEDSPPAPAHVDGGGLDLQLRL